MQRINEKFKRLSKNEMRKVIGQNGSCEDECVCEGNSGCSSNSTCEAIACNVSQIQYVCVKKPIQ